MQFLYALDLVAMGTRSSVYSWPGRRRALEKSVKLWG